MTRTWPSAPLLAPSLPGDGARLPSDNRRGDPRANTGCRRTAPRRLDRAYRRRFQRYRFVSCVLATTSMSGSWGWRRAGTASPVGRQPRRLARSDQASSWKPLDGSPGSGGTDHRSTLGVSRSRLPCGGARARLARREWPSEIHKRDRQRSTCRFQCVYTPRSIVPALESAHALAHAMSLSSAK